MHRPMRMDDKVERIRPVRKPELKANVRRTKTRRSRPNSIETGSVKEGMTIT